MSRLRSLVSRAWAWLRARQIDRDLEQQIASHLEEAAEDYVRQGLAPEEARLAALRGFGGLERTREAWRDARSFVSLDHFRRDIWHAGRSLRRSAGFSLVVLTVLAISTGAVTAVFTLLNAVVLQPLPFPDSNRLVAVTHRAPGLGLAEAGLSSGLLFSYSDHAPSFEALGAYRGGILLNLRLPGEGTQIVHVTYASASLFRVLETRPAHGRLFTEEDGRPGFMNMTWKVPVLLSHRFWVDKFGSDPQVVGRTIILNNSAREVVGVLPAGFAFPNVDTQIWMLLEPARNSESVARGLSWDAVGRLHHGATPESAQEALTQLLRGIEGTDAEASRARLAPVVTPLKSAMVGDVAQVIWVLFGGMAFLLLVACANTGGLFLVRAEHRTREMAVRRALGAHGAHLMRWLFTEALLLTGAAAIVGLLIAHSIVSVVVAGAPVGLPRANEVRLDGAAVAFAATVAVLMAGFYSALSFRSRPQSLTEGLVDGGLWGTGRRAGLLGGDALIVLQVALALTLMVGSALMVKTFRNLSHRQLGFVPENVLTVEIGLPGRKAAQHARIYHDVVDRVRHLPGMDSASAASFMPLTESEYLFPVDAAGSTPVAFKFFVPGYFQAMGTPVVEGTGFAAGDSVTAPSPVLISAALARRLYGGEGGAVGKPIRRLHKDGSRIDLADGPVPPFTIVGVVGDVRETTLREGPAEVVYLPIMAPPVEREIVPTNITLVMRTHVPRPALIGAIRTAIGTVDPDLSVGRIRTMDAIVGAARAREAFVGGLLFAAATVSLLLGAIGIYGSVAQVVRRRTREIAIRLTLGARRVEVIRMVTSGSLRAVFIGGALGLVGSLAATRALRSLLFGVEANDPTILFLVVLGLMSVASAAALLAAWDAARVVPLVALRGE